MKRTLKIGSRGSQLAQCQAGWAKTTLQKQFSDLSVEIVIIKTKGDAILDKPLAQIGGKGLFTKELDEALLNKRVDLAIHSMKDLPFDLLNELSLVAITKRDDHRDVFVSNGKKLREMDPGARIGTSSLRRTVQILHHFPTLNVVPLRGNVDTRLRKLKTKHYDGIVLAAAGLNRLGRSDLITEYLGPEVMLSAIGQGALAVVCRASDSETIQSLLPLNHEPTQRAILAERSLLRTLEGSCQVPIGGHARIEKDLILLTGMICSLDGKRLIKDDMSGKLSDPNEIGRSLGINLLNSGGKAMLEEIHRNGT